MKLQVNRLKASDKLRLNLLLASAVQDLETGCMHDGFELYEIEQARQHCMSMLFTAIEFAKFLSGAALVSEALAVANAYSRGRFYPSKTLWEFVELYTAVLDTVTMKQFSDAVLHLEKKTRNR